jgi:rubrerythrin
VNQGRRLVALALPLLLAACATPADVRANHERALDGYENTIREALDDMQAANREYVRSLEVAERWDTHWWGIPAGGWVAILITVGVLLATVLGVWTYFADERRTIRRRREHELALEREKTEQRRLKALHQQVERGPCQVCGAAPVSDEVIAEVEKRVE